LSLVFISFKPRHCSISTINKWHDNVHFICLLAKLTHIYARQIGSDIFASIFLVFMRFSFPLLDFFFVFLISRRRRTNRLEKQEKGFCRVLQPEWKNFKIIKRRKRNTRKIENQISSRVWAWEWAWDWTWAEELEQVGLVPFRRTLHPGVKEIRHDVH